MGPGDRPDIPHATGSKQKTCIFGVQSWWWQKFGWHCKKMDFGPKTSFLAQKSVFFLRYAHTSHLFCLRLTWLNVIITYPCPEITLDTFGFPVGASSTARRVVFWHWLPKMTLFEPKMLFFGPGSHPDAPIGFGAWAVSHKTSIYFKLIYFGQKYLSLYGHAKTSQWD